MPDTAANQRFKLNNPPIVEMVVDIDCDLPPERSVSKIESDATASLAETYPNIEKKFFQQLQFKVQPEDNAPSSHQFKEGLESLLFRTSDRRQLTQFRSGGYSFNRLAPYEGLDIYLPEIKRTWENYSSIACPVSLRKIGLRTINRIPMPLDANGRIRLNDHLKTDPRLPEVEGKRLSFTGFMNQHQVRDEESGHEANLVLASQGQKEGSLILLLDIHAYDSSAANIAPNDWAEINSVIQSLRDLKNGLFANTLTEKCPTQF